MPKPGPKPRFRLSKSLAQQFLDLLATSEQSVFGLLAQHPELPSYDHWDNWRNRVPWFHDAWRIARQRQGEFLVQRCLDLYRAANEANAHSIRVKFDILWKIAAKFHPSVYGDRPAQQQLTTVNVGISISPQRLDELRSKLDATRSNFISSNGNKRQVIEVEPSTGKELSLANNHDENHG